MEHPPSVMECTQCTNMTNVLTNCCNSPACIPCILAAGGCPRSACNPFTVLFIPDQGFPTREAVFHQLAALMSKPSKHDDDIGREPEPKPEPSDATTVLPASLPPASYVQAAQKWRKRKHVAAQAQASSTEVVHESV